MTGSADFDVKAADWRGQLRRNERRTRLVILSFIAIYVVVGLLVDVVLLVNRYPQLSVNAAVMLLLSFRVVPIATLIMGVIAVISLLVTYTLYDKIMLLGTEYHEVKPDGTNSFQEKQLYNVVEEMTVAAGLHFVPKVYVIEADYMNAFASGYSEKSAMVAITRGLMEKLDRAELQAVMAHELSHIRHHDVKLTLTVAVLSNLILIVMDILFYSVIFNRNRENNQNQNPLILVILVLRYVLPVLTIILGLFLSRTREYMADAGSIELMRDNEPMARALLKIEADSAQNATAYAAAYGQTPHEEIRRSAYLFDPVMLDPVKSFNNLFSTHPSIEDRLTALGYNKRKT